MNFKINKKAFLDALVISNKALSPNTPLPVLNGIYLEVQEESIILMSSDSNISIRTELNNNVDKILKVSETGKTVLDSKYLTEIVRKIPGSEISIETVDGSIIGISGGSSSFKLNCIDADEYPRIDFSCNSEPFVIEGKILKEVIDDTIFACSDSVVRPVLTGVNFKAEGHNLRVSASDSYRVAIRNVTLENEENFNITIPSKHLNDVYGSINEEDSVKIKIDNQKIIFDFGNTLVLTRLLDDEFPNVSKLIPSSFMQTLIVNRSDFKAAIDSTSFIKMDGKNIIKMSINSQKMDITSFNAQSSSFETLGIVSYTGDPLEITCRGNYLQDALNTLKGDEVTLNFCGPLKPIVMTAESNKNLLQLVSPFRSY